MGKKMEAEMLKSLDSLKSKQSDQNAASRNTAINVDPNSSSAGINNRVHPPTSMKVKSEPGTTSAAIPTSTPLSIIITADPAPVVKIEADTRVSSTSGASNSGVGASSTSTNNSASALSPNSQDSYDGLLRSFQLPSISVLRALDPTKVDPSQLKKWGGKMVENKSKFEGWFFLTYMREVGKLYHTHLHPNAPSSSSEDKVGCMIYSRVVCGLSAPGKQGYTRPPPKDPKDPSKGLYNSCSNSSEDIFVIFDNAQAYPEYIIYYEELDPLRNVT